MDYKAALRNAHIAQLKQRYLDIIAEASQKRADDGEKYEKKTRDAYIGLEKQYRDLPQQLSASGRSGGFGESAAREIEGEYKNTVAELVREKEKSDRLYESAIAKQQRLMNLALEEYNARIAFEDLPRASGRGAKSTKNTKTQNETNAQESASDRPTRYRKPFSELFRREPPNHRVGKFYVEP
ncbi:MAG: hypothetical protein RR058_05965 [Oscillospiraceae bacterium]